jgi:uncharacterized protein YyaL (SSP411 family)
MLYDNALLLRVGVHLLQATDDAGQEEELRAVCADTIGWLEREMTSPGGGFYSTLDADSEGEEGKFYVWSHDELRELLGADADEMLRFWSVTPEGNFEGHSILHVGENVARPRAETLARARQRLFHARENRARPGRDEKILAAWNGLMLRALAEAARVFGDDRWRELALRNGEFLFQHMVRDGRVLRSHKDGVSRIAGFLEDHAAVGLGALALYELTFDTRWIERARALTDAVVQWFWDDRAGAFFDTPSDHEELVTRPRDITDNATPSGSSLAVELLLRLGDLLGDADMTRRAKVRSRRHGGTDGPLPPCLRACAHGRGSRRVRRRGGGTRR